MAGRMGNKNKTQECLQIYKIDVKRNLLFLEGSVPGKRGGFLKVTLFSDPVVNLGSNRNSNSDPKGERLIEEAI